jgi:OmpA-OmpF porin, OOP family
MLMKSNPEPKISVEGHTGNTGTPKSNKTLSDDRAKAIMTEIVAHGIDAKRRSAVGYG